MKIEHRTTDKTTFSELSLFVDDIQQYRSNPKLASKLLTILVDPMIWPRNENPRSFEDVAHALTLIDRVFPGCLISHQKTDDLYTVSIQPRGWKASIRRHDRDLCFALCHTLALTKWHELSGEGPELAPEPAHTNIIQFGKRLRPPERQ